MVGSEVAGVELGAHPALAGGGVPRGVLGHDLAVRLPVRVERVEDDQPRALRVGGSEDRLLDPRHDLHLEVVADVDAVVHDVGPGHGRAGALRSGDIGGVPLDALDRGPVPRPVDQPDGPPPADQLAGECGSGGSGAENGVQRAGGGHEGSFRGSGGQGAERSGPGPAPRATTYSQSL